MPVAQDSNRIGAWGQWQVAPWCCPCIFWHVASQLPKMPGFFLCGETHHSPFVMDQPCPYLVFSVWVASCKACRLQTLNQLQTPVVFNYWMEILSLQWLFGLWFGLLCIHCAFVYGLMAAGSVAWLQPMWANRTRASCWEPETAQWAPTSYTTPACLQLLCEKISVDDDMLIWEASKRSLRFLVSELTS